MTPEIHSIIKEALAAHETFRKLGYSPDEIYLRPMPGRLFSTLRSGGKEFNLDLGEHDIADVNELVKMWHEAAKWWNTGGAQTKRQVLYESTRVRRETVNIIAAMAANGFRTRRADA